MRIPGRLGIILMITMLVIFSMRMLKSKDEPSIFDVPKKLQTNKMSLKVWLYSTFNGVEVFCTSKGGNEDDRLYLEPATQYLSIPPEFYSKLKDSGYILTLYGAFYKGKGIPQRFLMAQPKPNKYAVFRYENLEVTKD